MKPAKANRSWMKSLLEAAETPILGHVTGTGRRRGFAHPHETPTRVKSGARH
eukprot:CAMPEP_0206144506 /NCGR_PEP_ID=MMETSP1473-20131121/24300_1 /ASSEMBLY_ACC=CAM_ASM_001109 /TAXON_ID=1461547 /ORGANISM="Stichococcus sp, Strain RCC1054" /LENGTH=51 /DNA_ID=CAMNT_0053540345 /DNA_START=229 /DNA_END=384 /DNA_ORIENTATION=-